MSPQTVAVAARAVDEDHLGGLAARSLAENHIAAAGPAITARLGRELTKPNPSLNDIFCECRALEELSVTEALPLMRFAPQFCTVEHPIRVLEGTWACEPPCTSCGWFESYEAPFDTGIVPVGQ